MPRKRIARRPDPWSLHRRLHLMSASSLGNKSANRHAMSERNSFHDTLLGSADRPELAHLPEDCTSAVGEATIPRAKIGKGIKRDMP